MLQNASNLELKRELDRRISEIKKLDLSKISLDELINKLTILSGQKRSTIIEDWLSINVFERKVPSSIDKGDLAVGETYIELKSRFLPIAELNKGVVHKAGQIRLWQQVDAYLFLTSDTEGITTDLYYIPKSKLIELFRRNKIQFSSSHVKGNSALKENFINSDFSSKIELGISMHNKHYDWSEFRVTVKELKSICQKLRN